jgi:hypothetical protein
LLLDDKHVSPHMSVEPTMTQEIPSTEIKIDPWEGDHLAQ